MKLPKYSYVQQDVQGVSISLGSAYAFLWDWFSNYKEEVRGMIFKSLLVLEFYSFGSL